MSQYKAYTYAQALSDVEQVMKQAQVTEADAIEALLDTDTLEDAVRVASYRKEAAKACTIKRQNLSGDWFITDCLNREEAEILFKHYSQGPFKRVEKWTWGESHHFVFDKRSNDICKHWNGSGTPTTI